MSIDDLTPKQREAIRKAAQKFKDSLAGMDVTITVGDRSTRILPDGTVEAHDERDAEDIRDSIAAANERHDAVPKCEICNLPEIFTVHTDESAKGHHPFVAAETGDTG